MNQHLKLDQCKILVLLVHNIFERYYDS
ncbi:hypothetical protein CY0110_15782 [Crocosphaera chwakensis CCY0110]|uniref:Uncharacterized protein n=1 Tax=Crocosphaera chwakensis CCY0110 TaxID=391612 RepID=A3IHI8_9CHRO|nr:hypothetical protein CY0110_15782 [Crocosphaera chwakensis CCY0110]